MGVPQGSILGVFLFNTATDDLEDGEGIGPQGDPSTEESSDWSDTGSPPPVGGDLTSTPAATAPGYSLLPDDSPVRGRAWPDARYLPVESNARRAERAAVRRIVYSSEEETAITEEYSRKNARRVERTPLIFKYVDDNLQLNRVNMETAGMGRDDRGRYRENTEPHVRTPSGK